MSINEIARYARIKGLNLVGTGDFTHPKWLEELSETLANEPGSDLFKAKIESDSTVRFMVTAEVSTIFMRENRSKKIHHVILTPSLEVAQQVNDVLSKFGDLSSDGRPTLNMDASHLVEEVTQISAENMIFPAHVWTPWFSLFGAQSGFDSVEECYLDMAQRIHALETGLSSDPSMNWRISKLDRFTLVSNSDSHSFWPWRMGREANVFELDELSYREVVRAIASKDRKRFKFTIETDPAYGKYHWTGHRDCNVSLPAKEAIKLGNTCPICKRRLVKGVEQRVEELADRPQGFRPRDAIDYRRLLPLSEIISTVVGSDSPYAQKMWAVYNPLVKRFKNEYEILLNAPREEMTAVAGDEIADAIVRVREGRVEVVPGFDGVYGRLILSEDHPARKTPTKNVQQLDLTHFSP